MIQKKLDTTKILHDGVHLELVTKKYSLYKKNLLHTIKNILKLLKLKNASINIQFVSDQRMIARNKCFFKRNRSTDVIAFPWNTQSGKVARNAFLGDIIICVDRAYYRAESYGNSFNEEFVTYVIHGILHLLGYDDISSSKKNIMMRKQADIFNCLKKSGIFKNKIVQRK
ncbi:rRNA maturation RNase YbeY [Candidatus Omnitrophota bacterium]